MAEKIDHQKFKDCGINMIRPAVPSIYKFADTFRSLNIVADDCSIQIPRSWIPLFESEEILFTFGQVPKMTLKEWVFSVCTLGFYSYFV